MDPTVSTFDGQPSGELILQTGRLAGARRPLHAPVTLLGRLPACDVRLNVESVSPHHCAILPGPAGLVLRDLNSESGTFVNNRPVTSCLLKGDDVLRVGPFEFLLEMKATGTRALDEDALHIQAAAVAAQQAAMLEEEQRLQLRRDALEKQEEQLAGHLEQRRQELLQIEGEQQQRRADFDARMAALSTAERELADRTHRLDNTVAEALRRRKVVARLWRRLKQRLERQNKQRINRLAQREQHCENAQKQLQAQAALMAQKRLQLNGDIELGRRQLDSQYEAFHEERQRWLAFREREQAQLTEQARTLVDLRRQLTAADQRLIQQDREAQLRRRDLAEEATGLENRIRNLRQQLCQSEQCLQPTIVVDPGAARISLPAPPHNFDTTALSTLADDLADLQLRLVEQWQDFVAARNLWFSEQRACFIAAAEMAGDLAERERGLIIREAEQSTAIDRLLAQERHLVQRHSELAAWQARLTARQHAWRQERGVVLARAAARMRTAQQWSHRLQMLQQRWIARRKFETQETEADRKRLRDLHAAYVALRAETDRLAAEMFAEKRQLAERALAIGHCEVEIAARSQDSVAAERRLEKLRRDYAALHTDAAERLTIRRQLLESEAERLQSTSQHLLHKEEALSQRLETFAGEQRGWENRQLAAREAESQRAADFARLQREHALSMRRMRELQETVERLAQQMIDAAEPARTAA